MIALFVIVFVIFLIIMYAVCKPVNSSSNIYTEKEKVKPIRKEKEETGKFVRHSSYDALSTPKCYERVDIEIFIKTYMMGASIPEDLFIELQRKLLAGQKYADLPKSLTEQIRQNLARSQEAERTLSDRSRLNNLGINQEQSGNIDDAILTYEKNVASGCVTTHPYERLMVLYRKRKEYDKEIAVIEKAISVFYTENKRRARMAIKECPSKAEEINTALQTCLKVYGNSISTLTGKPLICFNPYDINKYKERLEKVKLLKLKSKNQ